jgi:hypothetical protein
MANGRRGFGDHYRAVACFDGEMFIWTWIGSHEEYNKL